MQESAGRPMEAARPPQRDPIDTTFILRAFITASLDVFTGIRPMETNIFEDNAGFGKRLDG